MVDLPIPLYAALAHSGRILSVDDQSVVKDLASLAGTGGSAFLPFMLSGVLAPGDVGAYAKLRRLILRVPHDGAVTVKVTPWRDGLDTGQTITRTLAASDNPTVTAPQDVTGSVFQEKIELSSFDAPASVGAGEIVMIPRRSTR
jgi:hypothetical protein